MTRPIQNLLMSLAILAIISLTSWFVFYSFRHPGSGYGRHGPPPNPYPPHNYTPATHASPEDAQFAVKMLEFPLSLGVYHSLALRGDTVIVTVGPSWRVLSEKDAANWVQPALDWGCITTNRVRKVDFVDADGNILAKYKPVGGFEMMSTATQPTTAAATR